MIDTIAIINLLQEFKPEEIFDENTDLFESGSIDSFTIFSELLPRLTEKFQIKISPMDLSPENFSTPGSIAGYINRLKEG